MANTSLSERRAAKALSDKSVKEIRSLHARPDSGWTAKSLARIFDATEATITAVLDRTGPYKG